MKVLFLDHDGVICLSSNWGGRYKKKGFDSNPLTPLDIRMDSFDMKSIKVLNYIIEKTNCEIVISSDWKLQGTLEQMQEMYITRGIKPPIAYTENMIDFDGDNHHLLKSVLDFEKIRVNEINKFLEDNPNIEKWVAIDDMDLSELENFVHCKKPYNEGIKQCGLKDKIIEFLK